MVRAISVLRRIRVRRNVRFQIHDSCTQYVEATVFSVRVIGFGLAGLSLIGGLAARTVKMTDMPQLVGIFNGFGGGASALVAAAELIRCSR